MSRNLHNLALYSDSMFKGDYEAVYNFWAPDFHSHVTTRVNPGEVGKDVRGREAEFWEMAKQAFPDMSFDVNLVIEKDDMVVSNWTLRGTHTGNAFYDVPPSGNKVEINGTAVLRFDSEGKIVEHWGGPHCMKGIGLLAS
jgi:predicted ester cyclase